MDTLVLKKIHLFTTSTKYLSASTKAYNKLEDKKATNLVPPFALHVCEPNTRPVIKIFLTRENLHMTELHLKVGDHSKKKNAEYQLFVTEATPCAL